MFNDPSHRAIDNRDPLAALLEAEEEQDGESLNLAGIAAIPADALLVLLQFMLPNGKPTSPTYWSQAAKRLCALSYALGLEEVRKFPLSKLAPALGCSRAMLSLLCCELRDFANLDHRAGRSDEARQVYSARARAVWNARGREAREKKSI